MGKRTKFQVKEFAQLTLNLNSHKKENNTNLLTSHECCVGCVLFVFFFFFFSKNLKKNDLSSHRAGAITVSR